MSTIINILDKYYKKLDYLDLELIISRAIKKPREFVLAHPDFSVNKKQESIISKFVKRRMQGEPLAYILGEKEFYGLEFKVNKNVLIPRPETEMLVEEVLRELKNKNKRLKTTIIDVGTGSGNIIISLAKAIKNRKNACFFGTDISIKALNVAKYNTRIYKLEKEIKYLRANLLELFIKKPKIIDEKSKIIIAANLPYGWLAWKNNSSSETIGIRFEPSLALFTEKKGLELYEKLLLQLIKLNVINQKIVALFEFDPRQYTEIKRLTKKLFSNAKIEFKKDLAGKWRMCKINI